MTNATAQQPESFRFGDVERGQTLVLFVLALTALLGLLALVTDVGLALHQKAYLQAGVDAAALAGASELPDSEAATALATEWAANHGLADDDIVVTVTSPYHGVATKIEVVASTVEDAAFAKVLGRDGFAVSARAVGTMTNGGGMDAAFLVLNPTMCDAFKKTGGSTIAINNSGGIMVNSSCNPSIRAAGGGAVSAAVINYLDSAGFTESGTQLIPTPTAVQNIVADPFRNVIPPSLSTTSASSNSGGTAASPAMKTVNSGVVTLRPGIYYGGLTIKSSARVTLLPGIYIMAGGGFVAQGTPTINGNQVMVYSTFDPQRPSGAGACGAIDLSGGASWSYSPPASGTYKNIAMWQDRACTTSLKLNGGNGGPSGAIYAPTARVDMAGSGTFGSIQIIADSFDVSGSGNMTVDFVPYVDIPLDPGLKLVE